MEVCRRFIFCCVTRETCSNLKREKQLTTTNERIGGNQGKTPPIVLFHKINGNSAAAQQYLFVHDIHNTIFFKLVIAVLWLIQSQYQGRPGRSATRLQLDPHRFTAAGLPHIGNELF